MGTPTVSIVCAVNHYMDDADSWLRALASQTLDEYEVVIVDSRLQGDYGPALARLRASHGRPAPIRYLRLEPGGRAYAMNQGLDHTTGELVLLLGDDFLPRADWAETHLRFHLAHPEPTAVGVGIGLLAPPFRSRFATWLESSGRLFGAPFSATTTSVPEGFFYDGNTSVKRAFLESVGRFDESFPHHAWDDFELGLRLREAGMTTHFLAAAPAEHHHPFTLRSRSATMRTAGESARIFEATRPGPYSWSPVTTRSPWRHRAGAAARLARFALRRDPRDRERVYARVLDAAFSAGYRSAVAPRPSARSTDARGGRSRTRTAGA